MSGASGQEMPLRLQGDLVQTLDRDLLWYTPKSMQICLQYYLFSAVSFRVSWPAVCENLPYFAPESCLYFLLILSCFLLLAVPHCGLSCGVAILKPSKPELCQSCFRTPNVRYAARQVFPKPDETSGSDVLCASQGYAFYFYHVRIGEAGKLPRIKTHIHALTTFVVHFWLILLSYAFVMDRSPGTISAQLQRSHVRDTY